MDDLSRNQIAKCLVDLAERCKELGDEYTCATLMAVSASLMEGTEQALSYWMMEYAKIRIAMLKKELDGDDKI